MKKKLLIGMSLCAVIASLTYFYAYKGHREISSSSTDYVVTISGLQNEFATDNRLATLKYQNTIVELSARITSIDSESNGVVLGGKVFATFKDSVLKNITSGEKLTIKGRFLGYDELLGEFKIDQCSITN
jgi:hypothetical protein